MSAKSYLGHVAAVCGMVLLGLPLSPVGADAADLVGPARVENDASVSIHGRTVRLAGIYVPPTNRFCQTFMSPARCGSRAALALDFYIGTRFVYCDVLARSADGGAVGICWIAGRRLYERSDLAAWLITRGWALALPDAPFEYVALERIAQAQGRGVWSFTVDRID
jgi:endonuclease YncB( thermonuclease family)